MNPLQIKLRDINSIDQLSNLLEKASVSISRLGGRYVSVDSIKGCESLDNVAKKAMSLFAPLMKNWQYSLKDRKSIKVIEQTIDKLYFSSDELLEDPSLSAITKIFNWLRELIHLVYYVRKKWEIQPSLTDYYTKEQFTTSFPNNPLPQEPDEIYGKNNLYLGPEEIKRPWHEKILLRLLKA
ncbi:MAG: hypothetical protein JXA94_06770 [Parachlamydiales bacterium]|nr:hypothetical protein [Parachlamydiales bacterium]